MSAGVLGIFEVEVEVGTEAEGDAVGHVCGKSFADLLKEGFVAVAVVGEVLVGVGGGDNVSDAVVGCHFDHGEGGGEVGGAVVDTGKEMMV